MPGSAAGHSDSLASGGQSPCKTAQVAICTRRLKLSFRKMCTMLLGTVPGSSWFPVLLRSPRKRRFGLYLAVSRAFSCTLPGESSAAEFATERYEGPPSCTAPTGRTNDG
jgi:hypothetical protein